MKTLRGDLRFHPVGQGMFYTGNISFSTGRRSYREHYHFFYDCGSSSDRRNLDDVIEGWKRELSNERIELGVISHLDADHVNGLGTLLAGDVSCGTVVLPYLNPWRRIAVASRSDAVGDDYFEFMENPAQFLLSRGVEQVIFMGGGGHWVERNEIPRPDPGDGPPDADGNGPPLDTERLRRWKCEDHAVEGEFVRMPDYESASGTSMVPLTQCPKVKFVSDDGLIRLRRLWQFHFFQYGFSGLGVWSNEDRWDMFQSEVQRIVGTLDPHLILNRLRNRKSRLELRNAYRWLQKDHNNASIALWHGPVRGGAAASILASGFKLMGPRLTPNSSMQELMINAFWNGNMREENYRPHDQGDLGSLLTGDISLRHDFSAFYRRFGGFFDETSIISVPHHGSSLSWSDEFTHHYTKGNRESSSLFVACAGATNRYGHPHSSVVADIRRHSPLTKLTERDSGLDVAIECKWP